MISSVRSLEEDKKMWTTVCEVLHISLIWTNSLNLQLRICLCVKDTQSVRTKQMEVWHAESADPYSPCKLLTHRAVNRGHFSWTHTWTYSADICAVYPQDFAIHSSSSLLRDIWDFFLNQWQCKVNFSYLKFFHCLLNSSTSDRWS